MAKVFKAACVQLNTGANIQDNLEQAEEYIREAADQGAEFVATPEITDQVFSTQADRFGQAYDEVGHPGLPFFSDLAEELGIWLLVGSMCVKVAEDKISNRSFFFSPEGKIVARYDKIHLYDVDLPNGESHRESKMFEPGEHAVLAQGDGCTLGLSICYDLRFPHLYRDLAKAGANVLVVPAAFTVPTGQAHWETLLRARAIETGSFVIAPAQSGDHEGARQTYGHSIIIGPWGDILAEAGTEIGVITAGLDMNDVKKARSAIPALKHERSYTVKP